jgi:hypothetical protein
MTTLAAGVGGVAVAEAWPAAEPLTGPPKEAPAEAFIRPAI